MAVVSFKIKFLSQYYHINNTIPDTLYKKRRRNSNGDSERDLYISITHIYTIPNRILSSPTEDGRGVLQKSNFYHNTITLITLCLIHCTRRRNSNGDSERDLYIYTFPSHTSIQFPIVYYPHPLRMAVVSFQNQIFITILTLCLILSTRRRNSNDSERDLVRAVCAVQTGFDQKVRTHDVQKMLQRESHDDRIPQIQIIFCSIFVALPSLLFEKKQDFIW